MDSDAELAREESSEGGGGPKKLCTDHKQQAVRPPMIPPSVRVLCSTCAQPRWETEWNFSIEDGVAINDKKSSFNGGDSMNDNVGKGQKTRRKMGRVFYHRQPRAVLLSP